MKNRLFVFMLFLAAVLVLSCCALAEGDPLRVSMTISQNVFVEPDEITVSIEVTNISGRAMTEPVTLYDPDGRQVVEFGAPLLAVDASASWEGTWQVTQAQLDSGKIAFSIRYTYVTEDGNLQPKALSFGRRIRQVEALPETEINRTILPTVAAEGQNVDVIYEIVNVGEVDIENVTITENGAVASAPGVIGTIPAGETGRYTFTFKMGRADVISAGSVTFSASGASYTEPMEAETIRAGRVDLTASITADKSGGVVGDHAVITFTLTNGGSTAYEHVAVTDAVLGTVFADLAVGAGETVTETIPVDINETLTYRFLITAEDASGARIDIATDRLTLTAIEAGAVADLTVNLEADRAAVPAFPATVRFTATITNNSSAPMSNVKLIVSGHTLTTWETLEAGGTRVYSRDLSVTMEGTYQFKVTLTDQLGENKEFDSNTLRVDYAEPQPAAETVTLTPPEPPAPAAVPEGPGLFTAEPDADQASSFFENMGIVIFTLLSMF